VKVGIASTWNQRCGICTYTNWLGEALQSLGLEVVVLAERRDVLPKGYDPDFKSSLPFIECWSRNESFFNLIETLEKENIGLLHIQHQFGLFPSADNLRFLLTELKYRGVKIIMTLHDVTFFDSSLYHYFHDIVKYSDKIIVHTQLCYDLMQTAWECPLEKLVLIPHGTKLIDPIPKKEARRVLGLPQNAKILLSWGFIWESKGIIELVDALAELQKVYSDVMLIHAGGLHPVFTRENYLKDIIKQAYRRGLNPQNFRITKWINEEQIKQYFGACDLIILNYMRGSASASGAAHRAVASHRPIVGSDDMCIEEIPKKVYPRGDMEAMLAAIKAVLDDPQLQESLVKREEAYAEETSWERTAKKHMEVYK
jgi:glycosyltransferase involved in cell wall biosynthesis